MRHEYCDYFLSALTAVSPAAVVDVEILSDWLLTVESAE